MNDTRVPTFLYVFLMLLGLLQWAHVYPQLPDIMASHFSGHGTPNNWQPKQAFFLLMGVVVLISAIPTFVVPRRLASMPEDKINLPNKSYWLAPERREDTFRFVRVKMAWFGCALLFCCFMRHRRPLPPIFPILTISIGRECGSRLADSWSLPWCGWFSFCVISTTCLSRNIHRNHVEGRRFFHALALNDSRITVNSSRSAFLIAIRLVPLRTRMSALQSVICKPATACSFFRDWLSLNAMAGRSLAGRFGMCSVAGN